MTVEKRRHVMNDDDDTRNRGQTKGDQRLNSEATVSRHSLCIGVKDGVISGSTYRTSRTYIHAIYYVFIFYYSMLRLVLRVMAGLRTPL